jgi:hypothetical protein
MAGRDTSDLEHAGEALPILDRESLARQSMGDRGLQRDVLALFFEHSATVLKFIREAPDMAVRRDRAHLLRGSALSVGALQVADAARRLELLPMTENAGPLLDCLASLHASVAEARAAIAGLLGDGEGAGL